MTRYHPCNHGRRNDITSRDGETPLRTHIRGSKREKSCEQFTKKSQRKNRYVTLHQPSMPTLFPQADVRCRYRVCCGICISCAGKFTTDRFIGALEKLQFQVVKMLSRANDHCQQLILLSRRSHGRGQERGSFCFIVFCTIPKNISTSHNVCLPYSGSTLVNYAHS